MNNRLFLRCASLLIIVFIVVGLINDPCAMFGELLTAVRAELPFLNGNATDISVASVQQNYANNFSFRTSMIDANGSILRFLGSRGYYRGKGIYITENRYGERYIVSPSDWTSTDYEVEQTLAFKEYLDGLDIELLYVNAPTKYVDDIFIQEQFGVATYSNRNADMFLNRISGSGIHCVDLREKMVEDNLTVEDLFYRTDHHWNVPSGLWGTRHVANALNQYCDYNIDLGIYDSNNYSFTEYEDCWLGEQGMVLSSSYVGLDDFTSVTPNFDTSFSLETRDGAVTNGSFDIMVNKEFYSTDLDILSLGSWHYSYMGQGIHGSIVRNDNVEEGKILLLADSYSQVVIPFLAEGASEVSTLVLRDYTGNLKDYIEQNNFDTVVILYAQFMIGAHDSSASANYQMFNFGGLE